MRVYLDHNASAPILQDSIDAMVDSLKVIGNPSSIHRSGRSARSIVEHSRNKIIKMLDSVEHNIVFTSGATEANSLALASTESLKAVISSIEHPSVLNYRKNKILVPVSKTGVILIDEFEKIMRKLRNENIFVSVMAVNNETGVIQPIEEIMKVCKKFNVVTHVDAVQAVGRIPINLNTSFWKQIDLITISSHKIGGPKGVGCLVYNDRVQSLVNPIIRGGGQEKEKRAGTEAVQLIAGFGVAIEHASSFSINKTENSRNLIEKLCLNKCPNSMVIGYNSPRVSNTSNIAFKNLKAENLVIALDLEGYEVSSGSACSSGKISDSHVIKAMGFNNNITKSCIRISLSYPLNIKDIENFILTLNNIVKKIKSL